MTTQTPLTQSFILPEGLAQRDREIRAQSILQSFNQQTAFFQNADTQLWEFANANLNTHLVKADVSDATLLHSAFGVSEIGSRSTDTDIDGFANERFDTRTRELITNPTKGRTLLKISPQEKTFWVVYKIANLLRNHRQSTETNDGSNRPAIMNLFVGDDAASISPDRFYLIQMLIQDYMDLSSNGFFIDPATRKANSGLVKLVDSLKIKIHTLLLSQFNTFTNKDLFDYFKYANSIDDIGEKDNIRIFVGKELRRRCFIPGGAELIKEILNKIETDTNFRSLYNNVSPLVANELLDPSIYNPFYALQQDNSISPIMQQQVEMALHAPSLYLEVRQKFLAFPAVQTFGQSKSQLQFLQQHKDDLTPQEQAALEGALQRNFTNLDLSFQNTDPVTLFQASQTAGGRTADDVQLGITKQLSGALGKLNAKENIPGMLEFDQFEEIRGRVAFFIELANTLLLASADSIPSKLQQILEYYQTMFINETVLLSGSSEVANFFRETKALVLNQIIRPVIDNPVIYNELSEDVKSQFEQAVWSQCKQQKSIAKQANDLYLTVLGWRQVYLPEAAEKKEKELRFRDYILQQVKGFVDIVNNPEFIRANSENDVSGRLQVIMNFYKEKFTHFTESSLSVESIKFLKDTKALILDTLILPIIANPIISKNDSLRIEFKQVLDADRVETNLAERRREVEKSIDARIIPVNTAINTMKPELQTQQLDIVNNYVKSSRYNLQVRDAALRLLEAHPSISVTFAAKQLMDGKNPGALKILSEIPRPSGWTKFWCTIGSLFGSDSAMKKLDAIYKQEQLVKAVDKFVQIVQVVPAPIPQAIILGFRSLCLAIGAKIKALSPNEQLAHKQTIDEIINFVGLANALLLDDNKKAPEKLKGIFDLYEKMVLVAGSRRIIEEGFVPQIRNLIFNKLLVPIIDSSAVYSDPSYSERIRDFSEKHASDIALGRKNIQDAEREIGGEEETSSTTHADVLTQLGQLREETLHVAADSTMVTERHSDVNVGARPNTPLPSVEQVVNYTKTNTLKPGSLLPSAPTPMIRTN